MEASGGEIRPESRSSTPEYFFDRAFDVRPVPSRSGEDTPPTRFSATLHRGWTGGNSRPIGSYVYCCVLDALLQFGRAAGYPEPVSLSCDFASSAPGGSVVEIVVTEQKRGKNFVFCEASLRLAKDQSASAIVEPVKRTGDSSAPSERRSDALVLCRAILARKLPSNRQITAPRNDTEAHGGIPPPPEQCVDPYVELGYSGLLNPIRRADIYGEENMGATIRMGCCPDRLRAAHKAKNPLSTFEGIHRVWHSDDRPHDILSAAFAADMMPVNWILANFANPEHDYVPSSLSLHLTFYAQPKSGSRELFRSMSSGLLALGLKDEGLGEFEIRIWDATGTLVCVSRQTVAVARVPKSYLQEVLGDEKPRL